MSSLPQRKKSPEEIARLREELGIPGAEPLVSPEPHEDSAVTGLEINVIEEKAPAVFRDEPLRGSKPVRSLRKSEQVAVFKAAGTSASSGLPYHRHSDEELEEIRRREALALMYSKPNPKLVPARLWMIIGGYIAAPAGALGAYFYEFHIAATFPLLACSLAAATFIGMRHPISRHHAAFVAMLSFFVLVFAILHHFPNLRNAT